MDSVQVNNCSESVQSSAEELETELRDALCCLHQSDYVPSTRLLALTGCRPTDGVLAVQTAILNAIDALEPSPTAPATAESRLVHKTLVNRFVLRLTQEQTAERMNLSLSSTRRAQQRAIHALARWLWEASSAGEAVAEDGHEHPSDTTQAPSWRAQTEREMASLQAQAPNAVADVAQTLRDVLELRAILAPRDEVELQVESVQPDLTAPLHPSVLRQILIASLRRLAGYTTTGPVTIFAGREDGQTKITISAPLSADDTVTPADLTRHILAPEPTTVDAHIDHGQAFLWIRVPATDTTTVLAIDDNPDMVHFYRRSTVGTRYRIIHAAEGADLQTVIAETKPDMIVLDIMLPDVDGWRLLMRLHEAPETRSIPVIVCSVVREPELAISLGAAASLSKPVRRQTFLQALDQASRPGQAES
jgi:CheY-like chemotaxis protein